MVVDASVAVPWLLETPFSRSALKVRPKQAIAPSLLLVEAANVFMRYSRVSGLALSKVQVMVEELEGIYSEFVADWQLLQHAIEISASQRHKIYDCLYLALAIERRQPLATADRRLAAIARNLSIETELIEPAL